MHNKKEKKLPNLRLAVATSLLLLSSANAQQISYTGIKKAEFKDFAKAWDISVEDAKKYDAYMQLKGKYRFNHLNPLFVLSMISDDQGDKSYFAKKAAINEHEMIKREAEAANLIFKASKELGLDKKMTVFINQLTGVDTIAMNSGKSNTEWVTGDRLIIKLSDKCDHENCLKSFAEIASNAPGHVNKKVLFMSSSPLQEKDIKLFEGIENTQFQIFDRYEFPFLEDTDNKALHMRKTEVIREL